MAHVRRKRYEARLLVNELARALSEGGEARKTTPGQFLAKMGTRIRGKQP